MHKRLRANRKNAAKLSNAPKRKTVVRRNAATKTRRLATKNVATKVPVTRSLVTKRPATKVLRKTARRAELRSAAKKKLLRRNKH